jgi:hypothetical protein
MSAFRGFDWAFCSGPPILLSFSLLSADSTDSTAEGFDSVVAGLTDDSIRRSSSALILVFKEPGADTEDKDAKLRNALFTGSDGEDEFVSDIWNTPSLPRPGGTWPCPRKSPIESLRERTNERTPSK